MSADPRAALSALVDAFEVYDSSLYEATGEMTPFDIYGADDEADDDPEDDANDANDDTDAGTSDDDELDDHGDEDGDDQLYAGMDDTDFDVDRR